ncbi:GNAT family N-acetyltransferase [bacterium]|nr:GNAT family N-acetyltransferase [candidate division CSSED10-310 bacterium]
MSESGPELLVRNSTAADLDAVYALIAAHNEEHAVCARKEIPAMLAVRGRHCGLYVGEREDRIVGCVGFYQDHDVDDVYWAVWLYVLPGQRCAGIGKRLWSHMEKAVKNLRARKLYLDVGNEETHEDAIRFHRKNGFVREGKLLDYFAAGSHKLIFGKPLATGTD